ncbi:tannase and feruloyl esterase [Periconia macrospinosa]|uniref:Carboxylic ester hydrolase n=1 Tax=Periconia macrospinosa TaxID=97972 RepID=A0A2V1DRP8_9PLEO|nr:tannase and feruloyl esterase [Periconia macrospinosa]
MKFPFAAVIASFTTTVASSQPTTNFKERCTTISSTLQLDYPFTVNIAEYLAPNVTVDPVSEGLNSTCVEQLAVFAPYPIPVGVCRLRLSVETTSQSETYVEVWLPEKWEGRRVLTTGTGGFSGCIQYSTLSLAASYGIASIGTDAGHNGTSAGAFYNQPEVFEDFSWRAVYASTVVGKAITKQFYEQDLGKSYYIGCSMGGRQGLTAVQRNPELFDGAVVGAPAHYYAGIMALYGIAVRELGFGSHAPLLGAEQWSWIQSEAIKQCDWIDGAEDGIIEDPTACHFDWTPLSCAWNATSTTCLTHAQIEAVSKLFAPVVHNGTTLHPTGFRHGYETVIAAFMSAPILGDAINEYYRYIIYSDISWNISTLTLDDALRAYTLDPANFSASNPDISAFRNRGGKIIHWHGAADQTIPEGASDAYYEAVKTKLNATVADLDGFYRYFKPGGVNHCVGGPGADLMGQAGGFVAASGPGDSMLESIVEWVENGNAPDFVRGTKLNSNGEVVFRRKHCKFPLVNAYIGTAGNGADEDGWRCVERKEQV